MRLLVRFLVQFLFDDAARMQELVGDVGENRGAARGYAALGCLKEEAGEEFAQVFRGGEFGEVDGVVGGRRECGGVQAEMAGAKTRLRFRPAETALGAIVIAMQAAGVGWRRIGYGSGGWGFRWQDFNVWDWRVHGFSFFFLPVEGYPPPTHPRHCCMVIKIKGLQNWAVRKCMKTKEGQTVLARLPEGAKDGARKGACNG